MRRLRRRYGRAGRPKPAKVVLYDEGPFGWAAEMFDDAGHLRSGVNDKTRAYVEQKIAEWWPELPVELGDRPKHPYWRIK
jgi:hypothetical protein